MVTEVLTIQLKVTKYRKFRKRRHRGLLGVSKLHKVSTGSENRINTDFR